MPIWKEWKTVCDTCKGWFSTTCWDDQIPKKCVCGGVLSPRSSSGYDGFYTLPPVNSRRASTTDANDILRELEEVNNECLEESAEHL